MDVLGVLQHTNQSLVEHVASDTSSHSHTGVCSIRAAFLITVCCFLYCCRIITNVRYPGARHSCELFEKIIRQKYTFVMQALCALFIMC